MSRTRRPKIVHQAGPFTVTLEGRGKTVVLIVAPQWQGALETATVADWMEFARQLAVWLNSGQGQEDKERP